MQYFQRARIVVRAVVLVLNVCGISLGSSNMQDTITKTEEALRGSSKFQETVQVFIDDWKEAGDSVTETAKALFDLLKKINSAGFLSPIIDSLFSSMTMWNKIKSFAVVSTMIIASLGSGGAALIALIAVAVNTAAEGIQLSLEIKEA